MNYAKLRKVKRYYQLLGENLWKTVKPIEEILTIVCDYKTDNTFPPLDAMTHFAPGSDWGTGNDTHAWFHFSIPAEEIGANTFLGVRSDKDGWDANNPQFIAYINGKMRQGLDTNHREVLLDADQPADVWVYAYTGAKIARAKFFADLRVLDADVHALYYDLKFPLEALDTLNDETDEYSKILDHLDVAVSTLDLFEIGSAEFVASVRAAHRYMEDEFYGKYCKRQNTTVVNIGHTHIDCAWQWTLQQTKEKAQRSFSTVLELMRRYPEYKFMSSQALLYKDVKEEAPEVFEEIKARIAEGRWECEGAMWVEPDCNLPSGESLVRQILYGKNFFKKEFGVDNRVLWLPDVFGYSAALPQILRKSGVDWFVTSKISWNDVNRMPHDTFSWKGIDGTEINSYFLTAQHAKANQRSDRGTTYVSHIDAKMVAGAQKRYSDKDLGSETLLTFGFGDGGGGPTADDLENFRRGNHGVPGLPNADIGFAGDFLKRLEKNIEGNKRLPRWQGELYLEFHRGTYTTMARNKRSNRKCEFLYQNAELYSVLAEKLAKIPFPQADLHKGWEMILTNQFHDIIPGSSIEEVYRQSDIDYAEIKSIGENHLSAARRAITAGIDKKQGDILFCPTSFAGRVTVRKNGKAVYAVGDTPKGYSIVGTVTEGNHITIENKTVETDLFTVRFDDAWQIVSIYDKKNAREVLTEGGVGNEIRVYADYPDTYDAWEWQIYSREDYRPLTAVDSAYVVDDGVRKGIRIVRPFMHSKITQTIWFYDDLAKIEFETVADWHDHHKMVKAAFPVDINTDKATYEIQFGSIERPTHFNTSWDEAKFEVCGHKYADVSDGGYGVSLINDCKYGHDIHDGVMLLSLLRSPTELNPESDQGEIPFTYALCPHAGTLAESDTVRFAQELNNPAELLPATGDATTLPLSFTAAKVDAENVLCDTVKAAEDGNGTILRFYECKNRRVRAKIHTDLPVKSLFLCDLMENEIGEIPVKDGDFEYDFRGFDIVTFKIKN